MCYKAKFAIDEWRSGTCSEGIDEVKFTDQVYRDDYKFHLRQLEKWDELTSKTSKSALNYRRKLLSEAL